MLKEKECWITVEIKVDRLFVPFDLEIKVRYSVIFLNTFYINLHNLMTDCLIQYAIIRCILCHYKTIILKRKYRLYNDYNLVFHNQKRQDLRHLIMIRATCLTLISYRYNTVLNDECTVAFELCRSQVEALSNFSLSLSNYLWKFSNN